MQAQANRTEQAVSAAQSVAVVQTLLRAGLGCITFMRELLPQDNFVESHFMTAEDGRSYSSSSSFSTPDGQRRNISGFKIKNMCRGYTDEADRILNYLEYGIFDALQKQYLRSFIFAIYLDSKDPNNIIEAYTFNFRYYTIAGTNTTIPIMTLGDDLNKMSLQDRTSDSLLESARTGKIPTLKDVKKSVKNLLKKLISSMEYMDDLPKRRYASFKLFYTEDTPPEYEPPHFKPGSYEKDKWHFMTHDFDEVPEKFTVGKIDTGYHSVEVNVSSIATYLPSSTVYDNSPFAGITNARPNVPNVTPIEGAVQRSEQTEKQLEDAEKRNVVWSVEHSELVDPDADGDPDLEDIRPSSPDVPIGVRNAAGGIDPISNNAEINPMDVDEAQVVGTTQVIPTRLQEIVAKKPSDDLTIPETQSVLLTQEASAGSGLPPSDIPSNDEDDDIMDTPSPMPRGRSSFHRKIISPPSSLSSIEEVPETQIVNDCVRMDDTEMLDIETQPFDLAATQTVDTIESWGKEKDLESEKAVKKAVTTKSDDGVIECECGISNCGEVVFCESGCKRWYHIWCMGYHSEEDRRLPQAFACFDCCVHADLSWELIKVDLYPSMMTKFKELAIFRRAIKIAENENPSTIAEFAKRMGCINTEARQLFKRLETEGFIVEQSTTINEIGLVESRTRTKNKGKSKQPQRRNVQKPKYTFNRQSVKSQAYQDYFNPDRKVESRLLELPQTKAGIKARKPQIPSALPKLDIACLPQEETQTQDETQFSTTTLTAKRRAENDVEVGLKKKPKISLAPPVDLAE